MTSQLTSLRDDSQPPIFMLTWNWHIFTHLWRMDCVRTQWWRKACAGPVYGVGMAITGVWAVYILRLLGASGVTTADLLRTFRVCSAIPRRFFWACSKFDGARGVCLAQLSDSPAYVRRIQTCQSQSGVSLGLHLGSKMKFSVLPQKQLLMKEYN